MGRSRATCDVDQSSQPLCHLRAKQLANGTTFSGKGTQRTRSTRFPSLIGRTCDTTLWCDSFRRLKIRVSSTRGSSCKHREEEKRDALSATAANQSHDSANNPDTAVPQIITVRQIYSRVSCVPLALPVPLSAVARRNTGKASGTPEKNWIQTDLPDNIARSPRRLVSAFGTFPTNPCSVGRRSCNTRTRCPAYPSARLQIASQPARQHKDLCVTVYSNLLIVNG